MRVRLTKAALADLEEIYSYIARDNPVAAAAVLGRVEQLMARLADFPAIGHPSERSGFRVLPLVRYPYLIFYEVTGESVVIHHVRHAARRRPWD
jgi:toxin ParE1/3/4